MVQTMPVSVDLKQSNDRTQIISLPATSRDFPFVRHKTGDCEIWRMVAEPAERSNTLFFAPAPPSSAESGIRTRNRDEGNTTRAVRKDRFPILGPTRQQTEIYFNRQQENRLQRLSRKDAKGFGVGRRPHTSADLQLTDTYGEYFIRGTDSKLRASMPNITTNRRKFEIPAISESHSNIPDVRFFAELVKPMQYKWRSQKQKVLLPSKHGYHPRSHSPTFKRLLEATEKLQFFSEQDSGRGSFGEIPPNDDPVGSDCVDKCVVGMYHSEPSFSRPISEFEKLKPEKKVTAPVVNPKPIIPSVSSTSESESEEEAVEFDHEEDEDDDEGEVTEILPNSPRTDVFKVTQSQGQLHLFLPQIKKASKHKEKKREISPQGQKVNQKTVRILLPSIDITDQAMGRGKETLTPGSKKKKQIPEARKKVKKKNSYIRCPSATDHEIRDHLNDVPTLISMENERKHTHNGICAFEGCPYHSKYGDA